MSSYPEIGSVRLLASAALLSVVLLSVAALPLAAQLSPGPLSEPHRELDGLLGCTSCHVFGIGRASFRCTDCHTEIRDRVATDRGYHARVAPSDTGDDLCADCHAEHYGREFEILTWPGSQESFDHSQTGYTLEGRHAEIDCGDCHAPDHMVPAERDEIRMDLDRSMLGLSTSCLSCHEDPHRGQLDPDCAGCHTSHSWTPAPGFSHDRARFALTGSHSRVACESCHSPDPRGATRYSGIAFDGCDDCHEDPHAGAFDAECAGCHDTRNWRSLNGSFDFDHDRTVFPLEGAHAGRSCASCHAGTSFSEPVAHDLCTDCHADYHQGQFLARPDGGNCEGCHTVEDFRKSTFTFERHDESAYPLVGMHQNVECASCHSPASEDTNYHPASETCLNCHADAHLGQFEDLADSSCESCHTVEGFRPSTFTLDRHGSSIFPLTGAHLAVPCLLCHSPIPDDPEAGLQFRFEDVTCIGCHENPHESPEPGAVSLSDCETCHETSSWDRVSGFDHDSTRFQLLGAHRAATCSSCHHPPETPVDGAPSFVSTPGDCADCHDDVHEGQFADLAGETGCDACHQSASWTRVSFDHEADSTFSLGGAHERVACVSCHVDQTRNDGQLVRVFSGTPRECASCH